tara:strand:- start:10 stop:201 length:192 start_codon:yes stop_codon:yes gene_type:complete
MRKWLLAAKEISPDFSIILLTGVITQFDEEKLRECKIDMVITKPFSVNLIFQVISETLKQSAQ